MTAVRILKTVAIALALGLLSSTGEGQERNGYVMRGEGRLVFIDLGVQDEVIPNDLFSMYRQEQIKHPLTGEIIGGQVPLGTIRVVEIFNRYSTAEVVSLMPGVNIRTLDMDAKQGLVRFKTLSAEEEQDVRTVLMRPPTMLHSVLLPTTGNPDGPIKGWSPQFQFGSGSKVQTNLPDRVFQLVNDPTLLADADATRDTTLENFNGSVVVALGTHYPLSSRASFVGDLMFGARSKLAVGMKVFPGSLFGTGRPTPEGRVGEPTLKVTIGRGGKGTSSLSADVRSRLVADATLVAPGNFSIVIGDSTLISGGPNVTPAIQAQIDSTYRSVVTDSLHTLASDSLSAIAGAGVGFGIGIGLPVTDQIKLDLGLERFGSIEEYIIGATYYTRPLSSSETTNPDGVVRSWIFGAQAVFDTDVDKTYIDLSVTYPVSPAYTIAAGFTSDFDGFSHFGLTIRGFINRN